MHDVTMFQNHTKSDFFHVFEKEYEKKLYSTYRHLSKFPIHCYTFEQYNHIGFDILDDYQNDTFSYVVNRPINSDICDTFAAIIFSPELCNLLSFSKEEYLAAIAHEIGHIIHFFNETLKGANELFIEAKADSIANELGLNMYLKSIFRKLLKSGMYSDEQCKAIVIRSNLL